MKNHKWFVIGLSIMLAVVAVFTVPVGTVAAAGLEDETPPPTTAELDSRIRTRLENQYQRLQNLLAKQAERVVKLPELSARVQTRIDALSAKGLDTSVLENALTTFAAAIPEIESLHQSAAAILSSHAGFGEDGKVTDVAAARGTLESAREAMRATHDALRSAVQALLQAMRDFRAANPPPTPAPTEPPA